MFTAEKIFDALFDRATGGEAAELFGELAKKENRSVLHEKLYGIPFGRLYLEFPLAGKAGFDLHTCYNHEDLQRSAPFRDEIHGGRGPLFSWFCSEGLDGYGMGLGYDLREGIDTTPIVYISTPGHSPEFTAGFFRAAGVADAAARFQKKRLLLPKGWHIYPGIHTGRRGRPVRIGGVLSDELKNRYAKNIGAFEEMLTAVGFLESFFPEIRDKLLTLFGFPFPIDIEIDIMEDGSVGSVLGFNLKTDQVGRNALAASFESGAMLDAMRLCEKWGIADNRWKHIPAATFQVFTTLRSRENERRCFTLMGRIAYLKVSFRGEEHAIDAKVYLDLRAFPA